MHALNWANHPYHERHRFASPEEAREHVDYVQRYGGLRRADESLVQLKREQRKVIDVQLPPLPEDNDEHID